ncbi:MAG: ABC transporter permease subunit [Actinomycetota bacterium]|nr:ABC transporter permease subunit [Actinomycetota bacterium]
MLTSVFLKTMRDRWRGWTIALLSMVAMGAMAMAAYQNINPAVFASMPEAYLSLLGLQGEMDVGALSISVVMGSYGAMVIASMAFTMGAAAIAGEERDGTLGLLLGNPKSRSHVLVAKALSMILFTAVTVALLAGATLLLASVLNVSIGDMDVAALGVHLLANCLFYGFLALLIGSWIGNRGAALGIAIGVMVVSFLGVGLLPLLEGGKDWVKILPGYYFDGSGPLYNGIKWSDVGVLLGVSTFFGAGAIVGVNRRDLKGQSTDVTIMDRIRANPLTDKIIGRLAGAARVSSVWFKTASEYQTTLLVSAAYMFLIQGFMLGPFYSVIPEETRAMGDQLPEQMIAIFGGGDLSTPQGWYQIETFGMMAPVVIMIATIAIGAGAIAGEESKRTMGLLLANPISRARIIAEKTFTMLLFGSLVGLATFGGVALGSIVGDLGIDVGYIAATCVLATLVGMLFGALALAVGAGTGRKKVAMWVAIGAATLTHVLNSLGEINSNLAGIQKLSPFYYYLGSDPLNNGMDWVGAVVLAATTVVLIAASFVLFQRRDIRQRD